MKILQTVDIDIDTSTVSEERDLLELTTRDQLLYLCHYHPKIAERIALATQIISCIESLTSPSSNLAPYPNITELIALTTQIVLPKPNPNDMFEFIWTKSKWPQISRAHYLNLIIDKLTANL